MYSRNDLMGKLHFIYILKLSPQYEDSGAWSDQTSTIIQEHFNRMSMLAQNGVVKHFGRTPFSAGHSDLFGVCVLEAQDEDAALELMLDDPTVREGIMTARLFPYKSYFPE